MDRTAKTDFLVILLFFIISVFAFFVALWSLSRGIGVSPDSIEYITTARNLLSGKGFQSLNGELVHFPPLYPLLLAFVGIFVKDLLLAARALTCFLFFLCAFFVAVASYGATKKSAVAGLCSLLIFISSSAMATIFTRAWSEPPFLLFSFSAYILLSLFAAKRKKWLLIFSSVCLGLAMTTRYTGISLVPPMIVVLLLRRDRRPMEKIADCALLLAIGCLPLATWLLKNYNVVHTSTGRSLALHLIGMKNIIQFAGTLANFILPIGIPAFLKMSILVLGGGLMVVGFLNAVKTRIQSWKTDFGFVTLLSTALFSVTYVIFLFASISVFDASTPLDFRILSPLFFFLMFFIPSLIWKGNRITKSSFALLILPLLLIVTIAVNGYASLKIWKKSHSEGLSYTSQAWKDSDIVKWLKSTPISKTIYTNGWDVIIFFTGKAAHQLPNEASLTSLLANPRYEEEMKQLKAAIERKEALVVYFPAITWRWSMPNREKLDHIYHFPMIVEMKDGVVYGVEEPK
jgi:4-amino-4-deoxy-L-arabinose transferase-like glycosyltransferase